MIERCVFVSLVTITWGSSSPTRTSCRWIDENTSINRCVVGTCARPSLRIQRQRPLTRAGHRLAQLPLQQRLHQQGEEVCRQQTLNPRHVLQEHRGHREVGLELGEPLFQQRLAFVRLEHFGGAQLPVIRQQREYAILSLRFRERLHVQLPRQCETRSCLPQILGLLARSAPCCLAERLFLLFLDLNQQPGTRLGLRQDLRQRRSTLDRVRNRVRGPWRRSRKSLSASVAFWIARARVDLSCSALQVLRYQNKR